MQVHGRTVHESFKKHLWMSGTNATPIAGQVCLLGIYQRVGCACLVEEHDVAFQQRNGAVPRIEGLAQVFDELTGNLGLGLTQRDALQQSLHSDITCYTSLPHGLAVPGRRLRTIAPATRSLRIITIISTQLVQQLINQPTPHLPRPALQTGRPLFHIIKKFAVNICCKCHRILIKKEVENQGLDIILRIWHTHSQACHQKC
jgi:hypothetical protein